MSKTKTALKVPVSLRDGSIMHNTNYARGAKDREEAAQINAEEDAKHGHHRWGAEYVRESVEPFTVALRYVKAYHHRSSAYVEFADPDGKTYPVFLTDLADVFDGAFMTSGWLSVATYETCKRGSAYGIRRVKDGT